MKIFLIGYMASGKTTIGKRLSKMMELDFIDLDQLIESREKTTINEIFESGGEALFRGLEMKYLKEVISITENAIISTGGGTPCFYSNMELMNASGLTVFLEMDAKSITYRLMNAKSTRPIISKIGEEELLEFVEQQMEERRFFYNEASITFNTLGMNARKLKNLASIIEESLSTK